MVIPIKVYDNMNNSKTNNVNFEYDFKFYICMESKMITNVTVQIVPLFMLSPTQVNGHSLKLHFFIERSQVKLNSLDFHSYFPLIGKFTCSKLDTNKKCFYLFKAFKLQEWTIFVFFKHFFSTKCAPFLLKIKQDFNIDD